MIGTSGIACDGNFTGDFWRCFGKPCYDSRVFLVLFTFTACREDQLVAFHLDVHGWIAEREELMAWTKARKSRLLACLESSEERLHSFISSEVDFLKQFAIDVA